MKFLQPIDLTDCGDVTRIFGWSFVAGSLPIHVNTFISSILVCGNNNLLTIFYENISIISIFQLQLADEMVKGAQNEFERSQINKPIDIEAYKESREVARDNASGIMYENLSII